MGKENNAEKKVSENKKVDKRSTIETTSFLPFIISGKYGDYRDGEIVSMLTSEFYVKTKVTYTDKDYIKYIKDKKKFDLKIEDIKNTKSTEYGTIKSLIKGIFEKIQDNNLMKYELRGFKIAIKTNIEKGSGDSLLLCINIFKSLNILCNLELDDFTIAEYVQDVYSNYFGKNIPLLNVIACFQKGIVHVSLRGRNLNIENCDDLNERYTFLCFKDGANNTFVNYNEIYKSEYAIFSKVKNYFRAVNLVDIPQEYLTRYLYIPNSFINESEKLVATHYFEEIKRCRQILEGLKDPNKTTKLLDAVNMSTVEVGAYLGFNKINNFLETTVIKSCYKKDSAVTLLNEEAFNEFVFVTYKENEKDLFKYLRGYKFFDITKITPNDKGVIQNKF